MKNKRMNFRFFIFVTVLVILLFSFLGSEGELVENLNVLTAAGYDLKKQANDVFYYDIPLSVYVFESGGKVSSKLFKGDAKSLGETRETRQLKSNKKFLLGHERVYVISEEYARNGINTIIDILVNNPQVNDKGLVVVCKGAAEDILTINVPGYASAGEYLEGMVKNSVQFNFFPSQFTMMDVIGRVDAEGKNLVVPYVEQEENDLKITGLALFKGDKMVGKMDVGDARLLNLLKFNKVKGMITVQNDSNEYINFYGTSKRKVRCDKVRGKYKFTIELTLKGSVISNEMYANFNKDTGIIKEFEAAASKATEKSCNDFVKKIQNQYKEDLLGMGSYAAAKYGRHTGVDWNQVVNDSDIEVKVKVKIDTQGRGEY